MQVRNYLAALAALLIVGGCSIDVHSDGYANDNDPDASRNRRQMQSLQIGMGLGEAAEIMGELDFSEAFVRDNQHYRVLFFRTQRLHADGNTTRDETTPVVFIDGHVSGWGDRVYQELDDG